MTQIWDVEQMKLVKSIDDDNIACCLRISHGHLFSGSFKSVKVRPYGHALLTRQVWNLKKQKQVHILPGHNHWVRALTISSGYLFTGGHNVIKVHSRTRARTHGVDVRHGQLQPGAHAHTVVRFHLRHCRAGQHAICGHVREHGYVLHAYACPRELTHPVLMWDLRTHEYVRSLAGHSGAVYSLAIDENGKKLFSGSYDNSIRVRRAGVASRGRC